MIILIVFLIIFALTELIALVCIGKENDELKELLEAHNIYYESNY